MTVQMPRLLHGQRQSATLSQHVKWLAGAEMVGLNGDALDVMEPAAVMQLVGWGLKTWPLAQKP